MIDAKTARQATQAVQAARLPVILKDLEVRIKRGHRARWQVHE